MKKLIFTTQLLLISTLLSAQLVNINPDSTGNPWWVYEVSPVTPEIQAEIDLVPKFVLSPSSAQTTLPLVVDNSLEIYMRDVFLQKDGSCGQASGIGYTYTYEINRLRGLSANDTSDNRYPTHFTFNIVRTYPDSASPASFYHWGWKVLKHAGCPNVTDYGGMSSINSMPWRSIVWESDYNLYRKAMKNRTSDWSLINATTPEGLDDLKHWLNDHNEDSTSVGGLACFSTYLRGETNWEQINDTIFIATELDTEEGYHAMTIVGYNDTIGWDFNEDDTLTNTVDLNGDSLINMHDWELGAIKIVNSYGTGWPPGFYNTNGYAYIPYKFLADTTYFGYPAKVKIIMVVNALDNEEDLLLLKAKVAHDVRGNLEFKTGYAKTANNTLPLSKETIGIFDRDGGPYPMQSRFANDTTPLECALDFGQFYIDNDFGKIFLILKEYDYYDTCSGRIVSYSIVDYRWNEEFEIPCDETNVPIVNHGETRLSVDYDLLPHDKENKEIEASLDLISNMVSRFTSTATNNSTLTVKDGVKIDMYDSEIHITSGSSLVLKDNITIIAKRGDCIITIDGNITIGDNVTFKAEDGASLELLLNNNSLVGAFDNTMFENCKLNSYAQSLTITNSEFNNCNSAHSHRGVVNISITEFDNTGLYLENTESNGNTVSVVNCDFINGSNMNAIDISNYENYLIEHNTIDGYFNGIELMQSGVGISANSSVNSNEVFNCSTSGMVVFNSTATVASNHIYNNLSGLCIYNNGTVALVGNPGATSYDEMNLIKDNTLYELYASAGSFPWYFRYNAIIDEDNIGNPTDPMVYAEPPGGLIMFDVKYNCWTESNNFSPSADLYPSNYLVYPTYCPPLGGHKSTELALEDFQEGLEQFENEEYENAKTTFESVIESYPETQYSSASMKELLELEKFLESDYSALQTYYETNDSIQADSVLSKLAIFLGNKCEIEMENWQTAIDHFEYVIENPDTPEDSIFAIIDLGYTYFLMDTSESRSIVQGRMLEHKPTSFESFAEKRDSLLALLPFDKKNELQENALESQKAGELLQNVPNPFSNLTTIFYNLKNPAHIQFRIFDNMGKEVIRINAETQKKGQNNIEIDMKGFPKGMYLYSIYVNGQIADTKKMIVK